MNEIVQPDVRHDAGSTIGTFEITVKFMQNSTWQGQIHWVEQDRRQSFRSALELLKLMDEALKEGSKSGQAINW